MSTYKKLICITGSANNNKYYEMRDLGNGSFEAVWGRVGADTPQRTTYPMHKWESKYSEKLRKGYKDVTGLVTDTRQSVAFADIADPAAARLMGELMRYSNRKVEASYNVEARDVTQAMIDEAQRILGRIAALARRPNAPELNERLVELYTTIPRKMKRVADHLLPTTASLAELEQLIRQRIEEEQDTLDTMSGQVAISAKQLANTDEKATLLDALGIQINPISPAEEKVIRNMMGAEAGLFRRAFRITNVKAQERYDGFVGALPEKRQRQELFWHGSRNENWISILQTSLLLRPTSAVITGKMFGYGLYFADKFRKSLGYTSYSGAYWTGGRSDQAFLALFRVHLGLPYVVKQHRREYESLTLPKLKGYGDFDSLHAVGGYDLRNDEFIVYREEQAAIGYLVEVGR